MYETLRKAAAKPVKAKASGWDRFNHHKLLVRQTVLRDSSIVQELVVGYQFAYEYYLDTINEA